jgi:hypothetical protein
MRLHAVAMLAVVVFAPAGCNKKDDASPAPGASAQAPAASASGGEGSRGREHEHERQEDGGRERGDRQPK